MDTLSERSLLVIGHPGHEFAVHGWIAQQQPVVCILTDGSGTVGRSRIAHSKAALEELHAQLGPIWGDSSDGEFYQRILNCDHAFFAATRDRLANIIVTQDIGIVVSDAIEGYAPTHDLCEVIARAAIMQATARGAASINHYVIPLVGNPSRAPLSGRPAVMEIELTPQQITRKRSTIAKYAEQAGPQLASEIQNAYDSYGIATFDREYFFDAATCGWPVWRERFHSQIPRYESLGKAHVASGRMQVAITYSDHVAPISERLLGAPCVS